MTRRVLVFALLVGAVGCGGGNTGVQARERAFASLQAGVADVQRAVEGKNVPVASAELISLREDVANWRRLQVIEGAEADRILAAANKLYGLLGLLKPTPTPTPSPTRSTEGDRGKGKGKEKGEEEHEED